MNTYQCLRDVIFGDVRVSRLGVVVANPTLYVQALLDNGLIVQVKIANGCDFIKVNQEAGIKAMDTGLSLAPCEEPKA